MSRKTFWLGFLVFALTVTPATIGFFCEWQKATTGPGAQQKAAAPYKKLAK